jgi:hypothetical protein
MPLSRPDTIPAVINYIWGKNPQSLLDVGVGFGGMGVLFRQTMDVRWGRLKDWHTKIEGIEIELKYKNNAWSVYNNVFIGDARDILPTLGEYDVIFFGDVLEHFEKKDALDLVKIAKNLAKMVIITTPATFAGNEAEAERFDNEHETHKCLLLEEDLPHFKCEQYGNQSLYIYEN